MNRNELILHVLNEIGLSDKRKSGNLYLLEALRLMCEDQTRVRNMKEDIYEKIAQNSTSENINAIKAGRAIRYSVEQCVRNCDTDILKKYFGRIGEVRDFNFLASPSNFLWDLSTWILETEDGNDI